jgi:hypothetical protein
MTTITINGNDYTLVTMPSSLAASDVQVTMRDSVATVQSPYVPGQTQTQQWPGADTWSAQITLPPMPRAQAAMWKGFLAECRGEANVFQLGDPLAPGPLGTGQGIPLVDGSVGTNNAATSTTLFTKGWKPTTFRLLMPADYLQVGYRLYMVAGQTPINSDGSGKAQIQVWPSIREQPTDGAAIILRNTTGLFRLAKNSRSWSTTARGKTSTISVQAVEAR